MKRRLMCLLATAAAMCAAAQGQGDDRTTYFSGDFDDGFPAGLVNYDEDGFELHFTMVQAGFAKQDSWIRLREEGTENYFAASASHFKSVDGKTPGPAADWMVLPEVWIRGDHATLRWDARTVNDQSSHPSTYSIYVSAEGQNPSAFGEPLATFTEEDGDGWQSRTADLSAFAGQRVHIAFVNNSLDGEILGIDNVSVEGEKGLAELIITPGKYALGPDHKFTIGGTLTAYSDVPVTSLKVECDVNGKTLVANYDGLNLGYRESLDFTFPEEITAEFGETVDFTVRPTVNTTAYDPMACSTTVLAFLPQRKVVIEEATGMWCQYCPKGIVAFDVLQEKYPDTFIGIAVHMMEAMDPLAMDNYANATTFPQGAPSGWVDRKWYSGDPMMPTWEDNKRTYTTLMGGFETLFLQRMEEQPLAEVSVGAAMTTTGDLEVETETRFPIHIDDADLRLAIAITEDHVWENGYFQSNRFSGGAEILAGYEELPGTIVQDYEFNHVARAIYDDRNGIPGSLPAKITAGETYTFAKTFRKPAKILNPANVKVIAMVIDRTTGEIVNANFTPLQTTGVEDITATDGLRVETHGNALAVIAGDAHESIKAALYDTAGRMVGKADGQGRVTLSVPGMGGIFVLRTESRQGIASHRLAF